MISGFQIRAACAFLVWDQRDLSREAVVPLATIEHIEIGNKISGTALAAAVSASRQRSNRMASSSRRTAAR